MALALLAAIGVATALAALTWACAPQPSSFSLAPRSGAPGDQVTATGDGFADKVEIHWDSAHGQLLAMAPGPSFSVSLTIPDADPGVHIVIALSRAADGSVLTYSGQAFEILGSGHPAPTQDPLVPPMTAPARKAPTGVTNGYFASANQTCAGYGVSVIGTPGPDVIVGTSGRDVIDGLAGRDVIKGRGGNDVICGRNGGDRLVGGRGRDRLVGGAGRDRLDGGPGRDTCLGGAGRDTVMRCERTRAGM